MVDRIQDQTVLEAIYVLLSHQVEKEDSAQDDSLGREQIARMLQESEDDIRAERVVPYQQVKSQIDSWWNRHDVK